MQKIDVTASDIRDFATSLGWTLVKEALSDGLFVLNSPKDDYTQLIFPKDEYALEFDELAGVSLQRLSDFYKKPTHILLEDIREVNDDVISLRYYSSDKIVNSLSFQEAFKSIEATKQMILSAGSTAVHPSLYHQRLSRTEAVELLKKTRFRHTEEGSFILKISCPIQLEAAPAPTLFGDEDNIAPISRKAFEIINESAIKVLSTIELDNFDELLEEQQSAAKPLISYNLCDSLVKLFDDERELPFELRFAWSKGYMHKIRTPHFPNAIRFPYSVKTKLEELKTYFVPPKKDTLDTFIGSVESLNGSEQGDGRRAGEVNLSLLIDNEAVKCKVVLAADEYAIAYNAHGKFGGVVKIKGRLVLGSRLKTIEDISSFELIQ